MNKSIFNVKEKTKVMTGFVGTAMSRFMSRYKFPKPRFIKIFSVFLLIALVLSWGISNAVNNDIQSATSNFSVSGTVSEVSDAYIVVTGAVGSLKSSDGTYNLNIDYLKRVETDKYATLSISDVVVGDKIIAQGVTNGYSFFIKRIVSFTSIARNPVDEDNATTTADVATTTDTTTATITATTTDNVVTTGTSTPDTADTTSTSTPPVINGNNGETPEVDTGTSTNADTSTSTITDTPESTTTEDVSTSTPSVIEKVNDVIQDVLETVKDVVQDVVDSVTGSSNPDTTPQVPAEESAGATPETPATVTE